MTLIEKIVLGLLAVWIIALIFSYTLSGFIHLLAVVALGLAVWDIIKFQLPVVKNS